MNEASDDFLAEAAGRWPPPPGGRALAATLALVGGTGLAAKVAMAMLPAHVFAPEILPLIFLVAVLISAVLLGFWCGLIAAITGFAALNFLFTEPLYTFHIARFADLVALVEFLLVAAFSGFLAGRLHDRVLAAQARAEALAVLGDLSAALAEAETVDQALKAALGADRFVEVRKAVESYDFEAALNIACEGLVHHPEDKGLAEFQAVLQHHVNSLEQQRHAQ